MSKMVFLALQSNDETRPIVQAIEADNPHANVVHMPAMVKIDAAQRLSVKRATVEEHLGRKWDVQELHVNLISISGNVDETDDEFVIGWFN
ncbi:monooxygenase [Burkholderia multivorans]|uniref:Monooxygenase n=1 Tax=Burkholderia pseudomultivorans TaxID=1207504 RepID=A0A6P2MND9_9BURK|nr:MULTISPECIES: MmoB/DmpM family protein [Burkholderia cepacia complex]KVS75518.1 monooxygenase [Burkholderia cepacia]KVV21667.1 monooxygenase [Burkholderia multivorans]KWA14025.1 monooxygenase [Burkholderia cepacia]MCA7888646.1 MmoB/DmpM family protein [Burkholderia contaminans]MDN7576809.1 MmoB/DmpM family protein [Burkholderia contaminans]